VAEPDRSCRSGHLCDGSWQAAPNRVIDLVSLPDKLIGLGIYGGEADDGLEQFRASICFAVFLFTARNRSDFGDVAG
jgi:hypothetical protein